VIQLICLRVPTKTEVTYWAQGHGQRSKTTAFIRRELVRTDGHTKAKKYWTGIIPQCFCEKADSRPRWEWHLVKTTLMFHKFERDSESLGVLKVVSDTEGSLRRERDVNAVVVGEEFHGDGGRGKGAEKDRRSLLRTRRCLVPGWDSWKQEPCPLMRGGEGKKANLAVTRRPR
jgi:hypothetical protein